MTHRMNLEKTYEIVPGPAPEAFTAYASRVVSELTLLLSADPQESVLQRFFEQNACMVPGLRSLGILPSAFPKHSLLISQPVLPGLATRVPDFMWISYTSLGIYPTLIEIERPSKRLFTARGVPTAEFTQARHQLAQWRAWFSRPENAQTFVGEYAVTNASAGSGTLEPRFILIYGRRVEFEDDAALTRERACLLDGKVESIVSYDRLSPDSMLANAITVKAKGAGRFRAIAVAPTFSLGPVSAKRLTIVDDIDEVVANSEQILSDRRAFLAGRLPYWRGWAQEDPGGIVESGDCE